MSTDVVVPINSLPDAIQNSREKIESMQIDAGIVGHVGDGNYHILLMVDMDSKEEIARAKELNEHVVEYALSLGGTCTGEHGVGYGKKKYQQQEHGLAYMWMKEIKRVFDPNNIMNPGKIFLD